MDLREYVKRVLRIVGHALVVTVHDRLNEIERQVDDVNRKFNAQVAQFDEFGRQLGELRAENSHLAESDGAQLRSAIYIVEALQQHSRLFEELQQRVEQVSQGLAASEQRQIGVLDTALEKIEAHRLAIESFEETSRQRQADILDMFRELQQRFAQVSQSVAANDQRQTGILDAALQKIDASLHAETDGHRETVAELKSLAGEVRQQRVDGAGFEKRTPAVLENELVRQVIIETDDYDSLNPETRLLTFLYSYLPTPKAIDVGAHAGEVSERLLKTGFEVYAFEPSAATFDRLHRRLANQINFHAFNVAVGSSDGEMPLYLATDRSPNNIYRDASAFSSLTRHSMPADLPFTDSARVQVRTLASLHRAGTVPEDISLVKIDTEGFDLEVIRGMGEHRYPVVMAEYWDPETLFGRSGLLYTLDTLVSEMHTRGYRWHIVAYRVWGSDQTAYYCNHPRSVPDSGGNVLFFQDYEIFRQAREWCAAVLPRTCFKPMPSATQNG